MCVFHDPFITMLSHVLIYDINSCAADCMTEFLNILSRVVLHVDTKANSRIRILLQPLSQFDGNMS